MAKNYLAALHLQEKRPPSLVVGKFIGLCKADGVLAEKKYSGDSFQKQAISPPEMMASFSLDFFSIVPYNLPRFANDLFRNPLTKDRRSF